MIMRYHLAAWGLGLAAALIGCGRSEPGDAGATPAKPVVVASLYPLGDLAAKLVEPWAEVHTFLPPGASEHAFEPTPDQLRLVARADAVVVVGMNLDTVVEAAARAHGKPGVRLIRFADLVSPDAPTPATAASNAATQPEEGNSTRGEGFSHDAFPASDAQTGSADKDEADTPGERHHDHDHDHRGPNPHLWLDPVLADRFIAGLAPRLEPLVEGNATALHTRTLLLRQNLLALHREYQGRLARLPRRQLVTFHNAFDLLAARYGLEVVTHLAEPELTPGGGVTARRMGEVRDAVRGYGLRVLYREPQFPEAALEAIRAQTGVRVLKLDPLGHPKIPGYNGYFEMMRSNLDALVEGQSLP